jgi:putative PIG3 family NAD(P)H quinone oxidoreductase
MKAVVIAQPGGPEILELRDVPAPEPRGDQVRVRVRACGLNRADLMQMRGHYPAPPGVPQDIPGLEYAGEVDALGPTVTGPLEIGTRVFGIVSGGAMAEYLVTPERMAVPIPANLGFEEAAAVPEVFLTALDALEIRACVRPGEQVLIHAVGSGVGTAACQLAHAIGCTVFGTARSQRKVERALALGLDVAIDTSVEDFAGVIRDRTAGLGVDVVIDLIGAGALAGNLASLALRGRMVLVGLLGGGAAPIDLETVLRKRITIVGTTLRARPIEEKIVVTQQFAARVVPWLGRGLVRPVLDRVFAFEDVRAAEERLESNLGFGKIVLRL